MPGRGGATCGADDCQLLALGGDRDCQLLPVRGDRDCQVLPLRGDRDCPRLPNAQGEECQELVDLDVAATASARADRPTAGCRRLGVRSRWLTRLLVFSAEVRLLLRSSACRCRSRGLPRLLGRCQEVWL